MADWYCSSAAYASVSAFVASTAYTVGQFVKATAPGFSGQFVFRCTTAGTASTEPAWPSSNNGTTTSGGATFTNVTGQPTYGWSAPAGTLQTLTASRAAPGDRILISSDHSETSTGGISYSFNNNIAAFGVIQVISVNRAGSVPPTASDALSGAVITMSAAVGTAQMQLDAFCNVFWQGVNFTVAGASTNTQVINFNANARKAQYLKNCAIVFTNTVATNRITTNTCAKVTFDNTTVQFGAVGQGITGLLDFNWVNTVSAIQGATIPTNLFIAPTTGLSVTCRGVDLSAVTTTLVQGLSSGGGVKAYFDSCTINSAVTRLAAPSSGNATFDEVDLVNCWDGTNVLNERYSHAGTLVTDRGTYLSSGAQDDIGHYALKLASSINNDKLAFTNNAFGFDLENTATGSKTATVEIASPSSLNNDDISLLLEYMAGEELSTWNPSDKTAAAILSNNNLTVTCSPSNFACVRATTSKSSGKYYFEYTSSSGQGSDAYGLANASVTLGISGGSPQAGVVMINGFGVPYVGTSSPTGGGAMSGVGPNGTLGFAVDLDNKLIWFRTPPSGNWNGSGTANPATATGGFNISSITFPLFPFATPSSNGEYTIANFGTSSFVGAVPSGFTSGWHQLNTASSFASFASSLPATAVLSPTAWNPSDLAGVILSNANLTAQLNSALNAGVRGVVGLSTGKYYWEATMTSWTHQYTAIGLATAGAAYNSLQSNQVEVVANFVGTNGDILVSGSGMASLGSVPSGTIIGIAVDLTARLIWFRICPSGNWNGSGTANPATGAGGVNISGISGTLYPYYGNGNTTVDVATANFGGTAFSGAVPSGFASGWGTSATGSALTSSSATWTAASSYATWNPVDQVGITLSNNNLTATSSTTSGNGVRGTVGFSVGKFYFEYTLTTISTAAYGYGLATVSSGLGLLWNSVGNGAIGVSPSTGAVFLNGTLQSGSLGAISSGNVVGVAVDLTAQLVWFRVAPSGNWNGSGTANPATGAGGYNISTLALPLLPYIGYGANSSGQVTTANFGASSFSGTVPNGFTAGWPTTPTVKQLLQTTFTPQVAGRVRGLVRLGKISTIVWINPQVTIT